MSESMHAAYRVESGLTGWAQQVLDSRVYALLATINPDGSPHTAPTGYAFDGERILIQSGTGTRKVRNIESDPRVRVLVQAPANSADQDGWVAADGTAEIVGGAEAQRLNAIANDRYLTERGKTRYAEALAPIMDVTVVVTPRRWQTWTYTVMAEQLIKEGYSEDEIGTWFLPADS